MRRDRSLSRRDTLTKVDRGLKANYWRRRGVPPKRAKKGRHSTDSVELQNLRTQRPKSTGHLKFKIYAKRGAAPAPGPPRVLRSWASRAPNPPSHLVPSLPQPQLRSTLGFGMRPPNHRLNHARLPSRLKYPAKTPKTPRQRCTRVDVLKGENSASYASRRGNIQDTHCVCPPSRLPTHAET